MPPENRMAPGHPLLARHRCVRGPGRSSGRRCAPVRKRTCPARREWREDLPDSCQQRRGPRSGHSSRSAVPGRRRRRAHPHLDRGGDHRARDLAADAGQRPRCDAGGADPGRANRRARLERGSRARRVQSPTPHSRDCPCATVRRPASWSARFASTCRRRPFEGCDVGVDIAENASGTLIERSHFLQDRIGVRFAAAGRDSAVADNEFSQDKDAGCLGRAQRRRIPRRCHRNTRQQISPATASASSPATSACGWSATISPTATRPMCKSSAPAR